jgi:cytochrome c556
MTLDEFVEFVTEKTGFCVKSAEIDEQWKTVTIEFEVDGDDGEMQVTPMTWENADD